MTKLYFKEKKATILSFFISACILLITYIIKGVYPFGDNTVLTFDFNAQYVGFYEYMYDVFAGRESIIYSWSRNLSGEFYGIYWYYLASPFNLIVWLFPRNCILTGLMVMLIVKTGAIGACMSFYLREKQRSELTSIMFSILYATSSYVILQTVNPMWLDGVMMLPVVVLGIERISKTGCAGLFIFSISYTFITCYYIGWMTAIFSVIYYIYYTLTLRERPDFKIFLKRTFLFCIGGVLAAVISLIAIYPALLSLLNGKLNFAPYNESDTFFSFIHCNPEYKR